MSDPSPLVVVYQAYGGQTYLAQTLYSLLSLFHHLPASPSSVRVVVYTDRPEYFAAEKKVHCELLTERTIRAWMGRYRYVHRLKIEMLRDAAARFGGPLLYLDSDTYWTGSLEPLRAALAEANCLLHCREGELGPGFHPELAELVARQGSRCLAPATGMQPATEVPLAMWNAGVVGIPVKHQKLLDRVLALCDAFFLRCYQRDWLEQLAFSIVLQQFAPVQAADQVIEHYWTCRDWTVPHIEHLIEEREPGGKFSPLERSLLVAGESTPRSKASRWTRFRRSYRKRLLHARIAVERLLHLTSE